MQGVPSMQMVVPPLPHKQGPIPPPPPMNLDSDIKSSIPPAPPAQPAPPGPPAPPAPVASRVPPMESPMLPQQFLPPNETLYVNNLNDKINPEELKKHLRSIFKQFGEIRDIIAMKSFWRRGQAWIIFQDKETSAKAMNGLQGFPLYDRPMRINFALTKSDIVAKEEGTAEPRQSGPKKPRAVREREEKQKLLFQQMQTQFLQHMQQQMQQNPISPAPLVAGGSQAQLTAHDKQSLIAAAQAKAAEAVREAGKRRAMDTGIQPKHKMFQNNPAAQPVAPDLPPMPSRTLFVENLPEGATQELVASVFKCYAGFVEVRLIQARKIAFVDYESNTQSTVAMHGSQGREVSGHKLKISYAK
eukprot:GHVQ01037575.1.p1 GENE.GHVQ01037575.1~~GHVQ01037575.1.p1  ORF type:complete len:358 (-),score=45.99 GHVQ01037575.1:425-1498(-)